MKLLIVESPTKAKTIGKVLGSGYKVVSSMGHVRDLPKSELGVDVEHHFKPEYVTIHGKNKILSQIKKLSKGAEEVVIATDLDREGEAIGWHILQAAGLKGDPRRKTKDRGPDIKRITFHEITKKAVEEALENPRQIDQNLVDAQQGRRVLDRLVGYTLSPLLWKKIRYGLSAGRVQSVAVKLIVDRERERDAFESEEYWTIKAYLSEGKDRIELSLEQGVLPEGVFEADLVKHKSKSYQVPGRGTFYLRDEKAALKVVSQLQKEVFKVSSVEKSEKKRYPSPPFITSSMQRAGVNRLGFTSKRTMRAAQRLYEAGHITYMRTDSTLLANSAITQMRKFVSSQYGQEYLPEKAIQYKTKAKGAQEAHEAIRPTSTVPIDEALKDIGLSLGRDEARLYEIIWQRALASQMKPALYDQVAADILAGEYTFRAKGRMIKFDGWLVLGSNTGEKDLELPELSEGQSLTLQESHQTQHFTQPPARFSEASLIRVLEAEGVGRPSTYASIISTVQDRGYVEKEEKYFKPTDVGYVVNDLLAKHFPDVVALDFTARMEEDLDEVAEGEKEWEKVVGEFYGPFAKLVEEKEKSLKKEELTVLGKTDEKCPECGRGLIIKLGKYGRFLSCSGFPDCKYMSSADGEDGEKVDAEQLRDPCPDCGGELKLKTGRFGKFIACSNYPECKFTKTYQEKIDMKCPDCAEGEVVVKKTRKGRVFYGCSRYPGCKYASWAKPKGPDSIE